MAKEKERKAMGKAEFARIEYGQGQFWRIYEPLMLNKEFLAELEAAHYKKSSKVLTPRQQEIFIKYNG